MSVVLCNWCAKPTTLPDGWMRPEYECPHCAKKVALTVTAATPPAQSQPQSVNVRATFHWGNVLLLVILGGSILFTLMFILKGMEKAGVVR